MDADNYTPNTSVTVGQFNDGWPYSQVGPTFTNEAVVLNTFSGAMPVNYKHRRVHGQYRTGGPWLMWKTTTKHTTSASIECFRPLRTKWMYRGVLRCSGHVVGSQAPSGWNSTATLNGEYNNLIDRGAEFWNRLRPDKPDFSVSSSVYELKDFIPHLQASLKNIIGKCVGYKPRRPGGRKYSDMSKTGKYYLALQFGWIPLLRDIQKFVQAQRGAQARLDSLIKKAGKPVYRRTRIQPSDVAESTATFKSGYNGLTTNSNQLRPAFVTQAHNYAWPCGYTTVAMHSSQVWAEGKFRYFLPEGPRLVAWNRKMMRRILGARVTPDAVYQIIPWSWLLDYFTGLGDFIKAVSPGVADKLICDYAYIMQTKQWKRNTTATGGVYNSVGNTIWPTAAVETVEITKTRVPASPFGWGIKDANLSVSQVAILAALGLSKLP